MRRVLTIFIMISIANAQFSHRSLSNTILAIQELNQDKSKLDLILFGGNIITMDEDFPVTEAIAIHDDKIIALGSDDDILLMADSNTKAIDLNGKTLLPGFIDSHAHWIGDQNIVSEFESGIDSALSYGWTSITEMFVDEGRMEALQELDSGEGLRVRVNAYLPLNFAFDNFGDWYQAYTPQHEYSDRLRVAGVKIFNDRGAAIGYNDREYFHTQEELNLIVIEAHDLGFQIGIHSIVDNSTDMALEAIVTALEGEHNSKYRHRIEHGIMLREDQLQLMSDNGIILSYQLPWVSSDWIDFILDDPGIEHVNEMGNWRRASEIGVPMIGSTDHPYDLVGISGPSMEAISIATTKIGKSGTTPPDWMLNKTLTVEKVLRSITIDAAYGTFQEDIKGSITVGKFADFVLLSDNPFTTTDILLIDNIMTMVGGKVEYCAEDMDNYCNPLIITPTKSSSKSNVLSVTSTNNSVEIIFSNLIILILILKHNKLKKFAKSTWKY